MQVIYITSSKKWHQMAGWGNPEFSSKCLENYKPKLSLGETNKKV